MRKNLTGEVFGCWRVIGPTSGMSTPSYMCECVLCKRRKRMLAVTVAGATLLPCFCKALRKKYGHIQAHSFEYAGKDHGQAIANCVCDCGREFKIQAKCVSTRTYCGHHCKLLKAMRRKNSKAGEAIELLNQGMSVLKVAERIRLTRQRVHQIKLELQ